MKIHFTGRYLLIPILFCILSQDYMLGQNTGFTLKEIQNRLQSRLDSLIHEQGVPGATFSLLFHDGSNLTLASGFADVEERISMKPNAFMFSGSVGKTFVAAVILKLCEKGVIHLKKKASEYLKSESWFMKVPNAKDITVEMLLNHTAGVPEYVYHETIWQQIKLNPDKVWGVEERLFFIFDDPPANPPGQGWAYADSHYILLGLITEKVTGKSCFSVLDELILKPCNLYQTRAANQRSLPGLVAGYTSLSDELLLPRKVMTDGKYAFNPQLEWTGGGLVTTVSDLTAWAKQLYNGAVLSPSMKALMLTPVPFPTGLAENSSYGLGCIIGKTDGTAWYGHTGFVPGYITIMQYIPSYDLSLAMQINTDALHGEAAQQLFNDLKRITCSIFPDQSKKH